MTRAENNVKRHTKQNRVLAYDRLAESTEMVIFGILRISPSLSGVVGFVRQPSIQNMTKRFQFRLLIIIFCYVVTERHYCITQLCSSGPTRGPPPDHRRYSFLYFLIRGKNRKRGSFKVLEEDQTNSLKDTERRENKL